MAVPTTNVTFSSIQTEFGGANPIALSAEYFRGGANVNSSQATSSTDGVAITAAASTLIRVGMFRGLTKTSNAGVVNPFTGGNGTATFNSSGNGYAFASVQLLHDGSVATYRDTTSGGTSTVSSGNWYSPTTFGIGSNYWVRITRTSFTATANGTASSSTGWVQLTGTAVAWVQAVSVSVDTEQSSATFDIDISTSSSGSPIVSSKTGISLYVVSN
jgi:hypothetical protein